MSLEKVVVVGASGYAGEELVRLLIRHPQIELAAVTSRQAAGQTLGSVFPRFAGMRYSDLKFTDSSVESILATGAKIVFLALPHGVSAEFAVPLVAAGIRVIDLSADFRLRDVSIYEDFYAHKHPAPELSEKAVYGLPEIRRAELAGASLIACPGCYPTSILVPLVPLVRRQLIKPDSICVFSMSGVSGAGRTAKVEYLFAECNESVRAYGIPKHRHLSEIEQELSLAAGERVMINFTPHLIPVNRGIHTTIYATPTDGVESFHFANAYAEDYGNAKFVRVLGDSGALPDTKNVVSTNFVDLAWRIDPRTKRAVIASAEDNLTKGTAGQAVQCMNIVCGWPEETGLF
jgi:N-acetyl-gamma-glutamyl-phosphate reductase